MHPFWAVQRLTEEQLMEHNKKAATAEDIWRFNMAYELRQERIVVPPEIVAAQIPVLTNKEAVRQGEVLIVKKDAKPKKEVPTKGKDWRDAVKRTADQAARGQDATVRRPVKQRKGVDASGNVDF